MQGVWGGGGGGAGAWGGSKMVNGFFSGKGPAHGERKMRGIMLITTRSNRMKFRLKFPLTRGVMVQGGWQILFFLPPCPSTGTIFPWGATYGLILNMFNLLARFREWLGFAENFLEVLEYFSHALASFIRTKKRKELLLGRLGKILKWTVLVWRNREKCMGQACHWENQSRVEDLESS